MSSKTQLRDYNKRLKSELHQQEFIINNLKDSIARTSNLIKEKDDKINKLEIALYKIKRWYQIIIKI